MSISLRADHIGDSLSEVFAERIRSGIWGLGTPLPTEEKLVEEFGASRSTVRRAMKNLEENGCVEAVRGRGRRVLKAPEERSKTVGFLATSDTILGGSGSRLFLAVQAALAKRGADILTFALNTTTHLATTSSMLNLNKVPGLIAMAHHYRLHEMERLAHTLPVVAVTQDVHEIGIPSYFIDYGAHACTAVTRLLAAGHKKIALVYRKKSYIDYVGSDIRHGYEWAFRAQGLCADPAQIFRMGSVEESGKEVYRRLIAESPDTTALVAYSSRVAKGMLAAASEMGQDLSRRFTVICLTDMEEPTPATNHAISYYDCPIEKMAEDAVDGLFHIMRDPNADMDYSAYYGIMRESAAGLRSSL